MVKSKYVFEFFSDIVLLIFALAIFSVMSCKETAPNLRIQNDLRDGVRPLSQNSANIQDQQPAKILGQNVKIVTGEEAVAPDPKEKDVEPKKDKPGAVAVKVEY